MESFLAAVNARDDHVLRRLHPCRAIVLVGEYAGREGTVDPDRADHEPALIHVDGGGEYDARTAGYKFGSHGSDWVSLDGYGDDEDYQLVHVSALSFDNPHALAFALDRPIRWLVRSASGYECGVRFRSVYGLPMHLMIDVVMPAVVKRETGKPGDGQYVSWMMDHEFGERF